MSNVVCSAAVPSTYRSPSSMSGVTAAFAESNGGANMVAANSSAISAPIGTCGSTMAATRTVRAASQNTITERREYRSASSARNKPPITHGR